MNKDIELGKEIALQNKASGKWMMPYREFVRQWEQQVNRGGREQTELYEALVLALSGYDQAGGVMSFLSMPGEWEKKE